MTRWTMPYLATEQERRDVVAHIYDTRELAIDLDDILIKALAGVSTDDLNILLSRVLEDAVKSYGSRTRAVSHDDDRDYDFQDPDHLGSERLP